MGIEPFLVGTALDCVLAQRLARRLCPKCKEAYIAEPESLESRPVSRGTPASRCRRSTARSAARPARRPATRAASLCTRSWSSPRRSSGSRSSTHRPRPSPMSRTRRGDDHASRRRAGQGRRSASRPSKRSSASSSKPEGTDSRRLDRGSRSTTILVDVHVLNHAGPGRYERGFSVESNGFFTDPGIQPVPDATHADSGL